MKDDNKASSWAQCRLIVRVIVILFFLAVIIGTIMSWIFYFRSYDETFRELRDEELRLAQAIYNETTARTLADMALMQTEAAQNASLILDIETREAEQAFVNASLQADIIARETGDAAIAARLAEEIAERLGNDTLIEYAIGNVTTTLEIVEAFDVYSSQQFIIIEGNISTVTEEINAEIAARIAAQAALAAADAIIEADLVLLTSEMTAEVLARIAQDTLINNLLHLITTSLLRTIDGQFPIAENMVFQSLSPSLVIANGVPSNQVTLTQTALLTLAGVGGDGAGNLGILGANGLSISFPAPHVVEISYAGPVPPAPMNYARLVAVYPAVRLSQLIQNIYGVPFKNGLIQCTVDATCTGAFGTQWKCTAGFSASASNKRCTNNLCVNDVQCNNLIGQPWHCRSGECVQDYCTYDDECNDAYGAPTGGGYHCQNYACTRAQQNTPFRPIYTDTYPTDPGAYQVITQPDKCGFPPCTKCVYPQPGSCNNNAIAFPVTSAYPFVYGNRRPFDPISTYTIFNQLECIFGATWEGQQCGFIMPASGTYIVQVSVNIRAGINQPASLCRGRMWFYMHIDRTGGIPPNWEIVDSDYLAINNVCSGCALGEAYISMTTTVAMSSVNTPPGTYLFAGWSGYNDFPDDCASGNDQFATWYSITYDITQVA